MDAFMIICISFFIVNILFVIMAIAHSVFADRGKEVKGRVPIGEQNMPRESVLSSKSRGAYHGGYRGSIASLPHVILYNSIVHPETAVSSPGIEKRISTAGPS